MVNEPINLVERAGELSYLTDLLRDGSGHAVVEGPAGIGKSALVAHALKSVPSTSAVSLAQSSPLEQGLSGGIVLQLLTSLVDIEDDQTFSGAARGARAFFEPEGRTLPEGLALFHALHTLCVNLSRACPMVLAVEDIQWSDRLSLEFVAYLMRRVADVPISVILTLRTGETTPRQGLLNEVRDLPGITVIEPPALSHAGAQTLIESVLPELEGDQSEKWWDQSGGVPLFLLELARHHREGDGGAAPDSIIRLVQGRLDGLSEDARSVAASLSVLGSLAQPAEIGEMIQMDTAAVLTQLDNLAEVELTGGAPYTFTHPVFNEAVLASVPHGKLSRLRMRAARILHRKAPMRAAAQLAALGPSIRTGEEWAAGTLYAASMNALERGGVAEAVHYLERALDEPADKALRFRILLDSGRLKAQLRDLDGLRDFDQATALAAGPLEQARTALMHGEALFHFGQLDECARVCLGAVVELGAEHRELALQLHAMAFNADGVTGARRDRPASFFDEVAGAQTPGERAVLAHVVADAAARGSWTAKEVRKVGLRALADGTLLSDVGAASPTYIFCGTALAWADEFKAVLDVTTLGLQIGERRGSRMAIAYSLALQAGVMLRSGRLKDAEQSAARVVDELADADPMSYGISVAWLVQALVEQGRVAEARATLDGSGLDGPLPQLGTVAFLVLARGYLCLAEGDAEAARVEFDEVRQIAQASMYSNPSALAWRSALALAQSELGLPEEGLRHAVDAVALARGFGAGRALSIALHAQASCTESPDESAALLKESVTEARLAGAKLEEARSLAELGRVQMTQGDLSARATLEEAMDAADQCGAIAMCDVARDRVQQLGGRPHRRRIRGVESLTTQERRVSTMAARGMLNREIASKLFISIGTVETHLTNSYRKLGVASRDQLGDELVKPAPSS